MAGCALTVSALGTTPSEAIVAFSLSGCQWLDGSNRPLYIVHVKHVTASEARRNWFRLLDEIAQGEVVVLERNGRRIVLRSEEDDAVAAAIPDYRQLLQVSDAENADRWSWDWPGPEQDLVPTISDRDGDRQA